MSKKLSKTYDPKKYEDKIYEKWESSGVFNPDNLKTEKVAKSYSIVMPPPNVTGTLHMGHAGMLALQDILIRFHRMKGLRTLWLPGTDHAAIATQTKVERILKEEKTDRHQLGREKFLKRVEKFAQESHDTIVGQIKKMGSSCDWSREAFTLDETRSKAVNSVFKLMYDDGLIYRGERIVNWCPRCHSTLADDEVEYEQENAKLYWIKYGPFVLATARPETKLGDTAVAVHPDDQRYAPMVGKDFDIPGVLGKFKIRVVADKAVDMKFGSGAIKVTPAHSFVDNEIATRHNLPSKKIIDEDGRMMENCGKYAGMTTKEARKAIVSDMEKMGLIDHIEENYRHNVSVCYRCGTGIEPLPSLQWFIDVNKKIDRFEGKSIKDISVDAVKKGVFGKEKIKIVPKRFEKTYYHWMENLRDWCISRQIWYGHRVPVWYRNDELFVGLEDPKESGWQQDPDTLDTWFSSGMWTFSTLASSPDQIKIKDRKLTINSEDFKNFHPTNVLETGYDILFFWVARMIIMTTYATSDVPFKDVYLHGLVLDEKGKKMSKSKGNTIDPLDMITKYGADATRLSLVIGSSPGNDLRLSEEKVAGDRNLVNKLWNISRYILENQKSEIRNQTFDDLDLKKLTLADLWIIQKTGNLISEINHELLSYRFSSAGEKLREFTWSILADWYLEISKFEKNQFEKAVILGDVLRTLLRLWHPFMPFVSEKIWQEFNDTLLISEKWPSEKKYMEIIDPADKAFDFEPIGQIIQAIRKMRQEIGIKPSKKINVSIDTSNCSASFLKLLKSQSELIKKLRTNIEGLAFTDTGKNVPNSISQTLSLSETVSIHIPLEGLIELEKEKKRQQNELEAAEKYSKQTSAKLENKSFVENAPEEVVEKEKEKLVTQKEKIKKIKNFLANIK